MKFQQVISSVMILTAVMTALSTIVCHSKSKQYVQDFSDSINLQSDIIYRNALLGRGHNANKNGDLTKSPNDDDGYSERTLFGKIAYSLQLQSKMISLLKDGADDELTSNTSGGTSTSVAVKEGVSIAIGGAENTTSDGGQEDEHFEGGGGEEGGDKS